MNKDEIKEITLKDLLPNEFYINKNKQMVAEITIEKINIIADILTNLQKENQRLNNIINELEKDMRETIEIIKNTEYQTIDTDYVIETFDIYCSRLKAKENKYVDK